MLFHFSDDPHIPVFEPCCLRSTASRGAGRQWLNGPLVWAIDQAHDFLYLFPRECPRVVIWPTDCTRLDDRVLWFGSRTRRAIAYIEDDWLDRVRSSTIFSYMMPTQTFEPIGYIGMWASRRSVVLHSSTSHGDLPAELDVRDVDLKILPRLDPLKPLWETSLHVSGIRLRNAQDW